MGNLQEQVFQYSHVPRVLFGLQSPDCYPVVNCSVYSFKIAIWVTVSLLFLILRWLVQDQILCCITEVVSSGRLAYSKP